MTRICESDCGEDGCPCANRFALHCIIAALSVCSAIAVFVWIAPLVLRAAQ